MQPVMGLWNLEPCVDSQQLQEEMEQIEIGICSPDAPHWEKMLG